MAPSYVTIESEILINASQDAKSSPMDNRRCDAVADVVEDSVEHDERTQNTGQVNSCLMNFDHSSRSSVGADPVQTHDQRNTVAASLLSQHPEHQSTNTSQEALQQMAKSETAAVASALQMASIEDGELQYEHSEGTTSLTKSNPQIPQSRQSLPNFSKTGTPTTRCTIPKPPASITRLPDASSSLAALRAKRNGQSQSTGDTKTSLHQSTTTQNPEIEKYSTIKAYKTAPLFPAAHAASETVQQPSTGRAQPKSDGMFARLPNPVAIESDPEFKNKTRRDGIHTGRECGSKIAPKAVTVSPARSMEPKEQETSEFADNDDDDDGVYELENDESDASPATGARKPKKKSQKKPSRKKRLNHSQQSFTESQGKGKVQRKPKPVVRSKRISNMKIQSFTRDEPRRNETPRSKDKVQLKGAGLRARKLGKTKLQPSQAGPFSDPLAKKTSKGHQKAGNNRDLQEAASDEFDTPVVQDDDSAEGVGRLSSRPIESEAPSRQPVAKIGVRLSATNEALARKQDPRTPAVMRSSPPERHYASNIDASISRKTFYINVDPSGPHNPGTRSPAYITRLSYPPTKVPLLPEGPVSSAKFSVRSINRPSSVATSVKSARPPQKAPPSNIAANVGDALTSFGKKSRLLKSPSAQRIDLTQSKSQDHISNDAHCATTRRNYDEDFTMIDVFDDSSVVIQSLRPTSPPRLEPTTSQIAMPPPALLVERKTGTQGASRSIAESSTRKLQKDRTDGTESVSLKASNVSNENSRVQRERHLGLHCLKRKLNGNEIEQLGRKATKSSSSDEVQTIENRLDMPNRPIRTVSQCSQTVDMHGSPIPQHLFVAEKSTALETYSQQSAVSSDHSINEELGAISRPTNRNLFAVAVEDNWPTTRTHSSRNLMSDLSSNKKARPGSPLRASQTIPGLICGNDHDFVLKMSTAHPTTNPFITHDGNRLSHVLRDMPIVEKTEDNTGSLRNEQIKTTVVDDNNDESTDITLADIEVAAEQSKRPLSIYSDSSSDDSLGSSQIADKQQKNLLDLGLWRSALKPHQLNLFDELVNISHRITQHLIGEETSAAKLLEDFEKRSLKIAEKTEQERAEKYQTYIDELKRKKRTLQKELSECRDKLMALDTKMKNLRDLRKNRDKPDGRKVLSDLMAKFC